MAKQQDNHSKAKDFIAQVEWENTHPIERGRPSLRHQPKWKYSRLYQNARNPNARKWPLIYWIVLIPIVTVPFGFILFLMFHENPGKGIVSGIIMLSTVVLIYFMARKPR